MDEDDLGLVPFRMFHDVTHVRIHFKLFGIPIEGTTLLRIMFTIFIFGAPAWLFLKIGWHTAFLVFLIIGIIVTIIVTAIDVSISLRGPLRVKTQRRLLWEQFKHPVINSDTTKGDN